MFRIIFSLLISLLSTTLSAKSIVVLGDSISAGYGIEVEQGWVEILEKRINHQDSAYRLINASISGDTSAGGLARVDRLLEQYQPQWLLLELGANDGLRGLSPLAMKQNLAEIIRRAKAAGSQVLLLSMRIPPNYGKRYVKMFYQVYPQLSEEMEIPYVPFILEDVALVKELMQQDGLHPNAKAQSIIADKVWQHLEPVLK